MTTIAPAAPVPRLAPADLARALRAGWGDFAAAPRFGLLFASVYVVLGLALVRLGAGLFTWTLTLTLGFPLVAPFLAVGLYEVSRQRERRMRPDLASVLGVVWAERTRQIPWAGFLMLLVFLFWSFVAHMLFALVLGPAALAGPPGDLATWLHGRGLALLLAELALGGAVALLLFALTAFSLPMLLDRDIDLVTAMGASLRIVAANPATMLLWAATIAASTALALFPAFLGLLVVLPVLGHATWHLYRRAHPA